MIDARSPAKCDGKQSSTTAPSPWKKPKMLSFGRTKSLKRKSEMFNLTVDSSSSALNDTSNENSLANTSQQQQTSSQVVYIEQTELVEKPAKTRKVFFNRFSVANSITSEQDIVTSFSSTVKEKHVELCDFFGSSSASNNDERFESGDKTPPPAKKPPIDQQPYLIKDLDLSAFSGSQSNVKVPEKKQSQFEHESFLPFDMSLKTRCRFLSKQPFLCSSAIKSHHESESLLNYAKFTCFYDRLDRHLIQTDNQNKDMFKTLLGEATSYWSFPYLPWLNLYPRNTNNGNLAAEPLNADIQKALSKSWNQSFKSLYNSLKSNHCPYFYVLTPSFVVVFKSETIGFNNEMNAILTPSTKGLRKSLEENDLNFTMPLAPPSQQAQLMKKSDSSSEIVNSEMTTTSHQNNESINSNTSGVENNSMLGGGELNLSDKNNDDETACEKTSEDMNEEDDENEDDDDHEEWMEKVGLNSKVVTLQRNNKNANKDSHFYFDNRPKSTLLFPESGDVQSLFNYLLNSKACVLTSGPLAGVPPTLLAPVPFVGATLQKIRLEQNVIKSVTATGQSLTQYALDLIGPIMPYHIHRLSNMFRLSQEKTGFSMIANAYEQSTGLNCAPKHEDTATRTKPACSCLDLAEWQSFQAAYGIFSEAQAVRSISFDPDDGNNFSANYL